MRQRFLQAQSPRSNNSISSDYLWFKYHEAAGATTVSYTGKLSGSDVSGSLTPANSMTNSFDDRGWITPLAGSGNGIVIDAGSNTAFEDFFRTDTLGANGAILFFGAAKFAGTPASVNERFFGYGSLGSRGGYHIDISVGANKNFQLEFYGIGGSLAQAKLASTASAGDVIPFMGMLTSDNLYMSLDGNWAGVDIVDVSSQTHRGRLSSTDGIGILCYSNYNGDTPAASLNAAATASTNEWAHHNMAFVRRSSGFTTTQLIAIAAEHAANPREIPPTLNGL